jgi:hypothetical protein
MFKQLSGKSAVIPQIYERLFYDLEVIGVHKEKTLKVFVSQYFIIICLSSFTVIGTEL